jgi:AraC-type transcriptional regulator N-terminus
MLKHRKIGDTNASRPSHLPTELAKKISNSLGDSGERATEVPGLMLYRRTAPTLPNPSTYEPSLLVIAQGRIRVDLGKASYVFGQSRFLLRSLELPVVSQVITASKETPYLAFFLKLATADIGLEHGADAVLVAGDAGAVEILKQWDGVFTGQAS